MQVEDDSDAETYGEENNEQGSYSKRKIVSNWDRYQDTEKEVDNESGESQRGTDFSVLLSSAGKNANYSHASWCYESCQDILFMFLFKLHFSNWQFIVCPLDFKSKYRAVCLMVCKGKNDIALSGSQGFYVLMWVT